MRVPQNLGRRRSHRCRRDWLSASSGPPPPEPTPAETQHRPRGPRPYSCSPRPAPLTRKTRQAIRGSGGRVLEVNRGHRPATPFAPRAKGFAADVEARAAVAAAAQDAAIGHTPGAVAAGTKVENGATSGAAATRAAARSPRAVRRLAGPPRRQAVGPGHGQRSYEARSVQAGDKKCPGRHPRLRHRRPPPRPGRAGRHRHCRATSRSTSPTSTAPCEFAGCLDPVACGRLRPRHPRRRHRRRQRSTASASRGVAPNVTPGQDPRRPGQRLPVPEAGRRRADLRRRDRPRRHQHVLLRRPVALQLHAAHPEDDDEAAAEQELIIETMNRALNYAHDEGVTLVGCARQQPRGPDQAADRHLQPGLPGQGHRVRADDRQREVRRPAGRGPARHRRLGPRAVRDARPTTRTTHRPEPRVRSRSRRPVAGSVTGFGTPTVPHEREPDPVDVPRSTSLVDDRPGEEERQRSPSSVAANGVIKQCPVGRVDTASAATTPYLQGTSMASPHATGVAALAVSQFGAGTNADGGFEPGAATSSGAGVMDERAATTPARRRLQSYERRRSLRRSSTRRASGTPDFNGVLRRRHRGRLRHGDGP